MLAGDDPNLTLVLLGNKCDSHRKIVAADDGDRLANENNVSLFLEVSARNGCNVEQVVTALAEKMAEEAQAKKFDKEEKIHFGGPREEDQSIDRCCSIM